MSFNDNDHWVRSLAVIVVLDFDLVEEHSKYMLLENERRKGGTWKAKGIFWKMLFLSC
jgi:hypothetical protein